MSESEPVRPNLINSRKLKAALEQRVAETNTLTVSEFKKFLPLFKHDSGLRDTEKGKELADEYRRRVDFYSNVTVVSDIDKKTKVFELPRVFTRVSTLNQAGPDASQLASAFFKALDTDSSISVEPARQLILISGALDKSVDKDAILSEVADFHRVMTELRADHTSPSSKKENQVNVSDIDDFD
jgi:hypothetical protein